MTDEMLNQIHSLTEDERRQLLANQALAALIKLLEEVVGELTKQRDLLLQENAELRESLRNSE